MTAGMISISATIFTRTTTIISTMAMAILPKAAPPISATTAGSVWGMILPITTTTATGCCDRGYAAPDEKRSKPNGSDENPDIYKVKLELRGYQYQYSRNCLQRNNGSGSSFSDVGLMAGISATDWSWTPLLPILTMTATRTCSCQAGLSSARLTWTTYAMLPT